MQTEAIAARRGEATAGSFRPLAAELAGEGAPGDAGSRDRPVTVIARPLDEGEWEQLRAFAQRLEREDLRLRFGYAFDVRDEPTLRRFFDVKPGIGEISWITDNAGAVAGIAHRIMVSPTEAEIALIVRCDLKRRGIGEFLLRHVLARSARQGLATLRASVLWENRPMLRLAAKIGYAPRELSPGTVELKFTPERNTAAA